LLALGFLEGWLYEERSIFFAVRNVRCRKCVGK
jgi:hypothetical protein